MRALWGRLFQPAEWLMNRLRFGAKFALICGICGMVALVMLVQAYRDLSHEIAAANQGVRGITHVRKLLEMVDGVQRHRGLSTAGLNGDAAAAAQARTAREKVNQVVAAIDGLDQADGREFGTAASWKELRQAWAEAAAGVEGGKAGENFARHTTLVRKGLVHARLLADGSSLTLDPAIETFYLMDSVAFRLPPYIEAAARLRGSGAAYLAKAERTPEDANRLRAVLFEGETMIEGVLENMAKISRHLPAAREAFKGPGELLQREHAAIRKLVTDEVLAGTSTRKPTEFFAEATRPVAAAQGLLGISADKLAGLLAERQARLQRERSIIMAGSLAGLLLAAWLSIGGFRVVQRSVRAVSDATGRMAQGDLTHRIAMSGNDEFALIAERFNSATAELAELMATIRQNADAVSGSAGALSGMTGQVSASQSGQSDAAGAMAAAVEELSVSISEVSAHSAEALAASRRSGELSAEGACGVDGAAREMRVIAESAASLTGVFDGLIQDSSKISAVVDVIRGVADQTNLLALNAAIEAARAGEMGRGFAVVADEVRRLAERTTAATHEIEQVVQTIQSGTENAVGQFGKWSQRVTEVSGAATAAGSGMLAIETGSHEVVKAMTEINAALAEQSAASVQITQSVERVSQMSEEGAASAAAIAAEAGTLDRLARSLQGLLGRFRFQQPASV